MKEIKAIIHHHMVSKVVHALHSLDHFPGLTLFDARGQGRGRGLGGSFKITEDDIDYHLKVVLMIVCANELLESIVSIIQKSAHTGNKGDGIIIVSDLNQVIRIRTNERQDRAL